MLVGSELGSAVSACSRLVIHSGGSACCGLARVGTEAVGLPAGGRDVGAATVGTGSLGGGAVRPRALRVLAVPCPPFVRAVPFCSAAEHGVQVIPFKRAACAVEALVLAAWDARQVRHVVIARVAVAVMNLVIGWDGTVGLFPDVAVEVPGSACGAEVPSIALALGVGVTAVLAASIRADFCSSHTVIVSSA